MIMPGPQASHSRDPPHFRSGNTRTRHNPEPGMLPLGLTRFAGGGTSTA